MSHQTDTEAPPMGHVPHGEKHCLIARRIQTIQTSMTLIQTALPATIQFSSVLLYKHFKC
jgi:hypothetical protein